MSSDVGFPPTLQAARDRLAAVRPADYARTRNALDGAATRLSPYLTHGLLSGPEVLRGVLAAQPLPVQHKLVQELGWRAYFRHVWAHRGDGILQSLHPGPLPDEAYSRALPDDVAQARTGVPVIDRAVTTLYDTGWLHNHARLWLASYLVHLRKLHWRTGADWLVGHLLDGDLASNHLGWQWVAGTGSHKPYLFNADNVARYAPAEWHSPGTVIDQSYEVLDRMAHSPRAALLERTAPTEGVEEPPCFIRSPELFGSVPTALAVQGRHVQLLHPWCLGEPPAAGADVLRVGVLVQEFHTAWPWSAARWQFVGQRLQQACDLLWCADAATLRQALSAAASVQAVADPHWGSAWPAAAEAAAAVPRLFAPVRQRCRSFSQYWHRVTRGIQQAAELIDVH